MPILCGHLQMATADRTVGPTRLASWTNFAGLGLEPLTGLYVGVFVLGVGYTILGWGDVGAFVRAVRHGLAQPGTFGVALEDLLSVVIHTVVAERRSMSIELSTGQSHKYLGMF